jgi:hypothetical protein
LLVFWSDDGHYSGVRLTSKLKRLVEKSTGHSSRNACIVHMVKQQNGKKEGNALRNINMGCELGVLLESLHPPQHRARPQQHSHAFGANLCSWIGRANTPLSVSPTRPRNAAIVTGGPELPAGASPAPEPLPLPAPGVAGTATAPDSTCNKR